MSIPNKQVPLLRFPEFTEEWEMKKLGDVTKINQGLQIAISERFIEKVENSFFYITNEFLKEGSEARYYIQNPPNSVLCDEEDILMTRTGNTGTVVTGVVGAFHNNFFKIKYSIGISRWFLYYFLTSYKIKSLILRLAGTSTIPDLNHGDFYKIRITFPSIPEQQKIAAFLTAVDNKIQQLSQKRSLLEQYKKGVMQQIFSQQIRFKDDNGQAYPDWEEKKLNKLLFEPKARNYDLKYSKEDVLSVSGEFGIVNQIDFLGRSYAGISVDNYHTVEKGDIVYTKSPLKSNPYGIIKVNKDKPGIVSTLYAVYSCKENVSGEYLDYYFQLDDNTNSYLRPLVHKGAKNDMKINNAHVLNGCIDIPTKDEQLKIVAFFNDIDYKIKAVGKQIEATQTYKKGLLQQLFV